MGIYRVLLAMHLPSPDSTHLSDFPHLLQASVATLWKKFLVPLFGLHGVMLTRKRKEVRAKPPQNEAMDVEKPVVRASTLTVVFCCDYCLP